MRRSSEADKRQPFGSFKASPILDYSDTLLARPCGKANRGTDFRARLFNDALSCVEVEYGTEA